MSLKIETNQRVEQLGRKDARIVVSVRINGEHTVEIVHASGPKEDVQKYYDGEITWDEFGKAIL